MWDVMSGVDHPDSKRHRRYIKNGMHGLEPGRIYFGIFNYQYQPLQSYFGGRWNFKLGYLLCEYRYHAIYRQYLQATPWSDMEIYKKTSP